MDRPAYLDEWKRLSPIIIKMTRKDGLCNHEPGQVFCFRNPYERPRGICAALWHVVEFYAWRVEMGFPSWEPDDGSTYRLHCPCETGTVWEMRKATPEECRHHLPPKKDAASSA